MVATLTAQLAGHADTFLRTECTLGRGCGLQAVHKMGMVASGRKINFSKNVMSDDASSSSEVELLYASISAPITPNECLSEKNEPLSSMK